MKRTAAPKLGAYAGLAGLGLLAAVVLGRPLLVALAAPFALVLAAGLILGDDPELRASVRLDRDRALEGETIELQVLLRAERGLPRLDVLVEVPDGLVVESGSNPVSIRLEGGERRRLVLRLRAVRWGGYVLGEVFLRGQDSLGVFRFDTTLRPDRELRVFPREQELRVLLQPRDTQPYAGDEVARRRGDGIEFADIRPFTFGDQVTRINWRATARRQELWVNDRHPERNTDVILFLDSFAEARRHGRSTLDLALRAAATLAHGYIARRDRVGLIGFGGTLRWLHPATGEAQLYRICEALLDTEILLNYAWRDTTAVPRRVLPPQSLVIALSPLLDERSIEALFDLRARGFDLTVIETSPLPFVEQGPAPSDAVAFRIWKLRREALRERLRRSGVAVVEWREDTPLAVGLEEAGAFRRHAVAGRA
ncbi:MAG TPA: DUF58 domain-containing protein [Gaiellaceae bacterium]|nr:DUF58 domain-containing protein [Gaiellaceae bacterium]